MNRLIKSQLKYVGMAFAGLCFTFLFLLEARAATNGIISRPAGFVRVPISANAAELVSQPFVSYGASINVLLTNQLTGSTNGQNADEIFKWYTVHQEYLSAVKVAGTGDSSIDGQWYSDVQATNFSDMTLNLGEGFFIRNRQTNEQSCFIYGKLVLDESVEKALEPGLNLIGYTYSTARKIEQSGIFGPSNSVVTNSERELDELHDLSTNAFESPVFVMGRGYWYKATGTSAVHWSEVRPYANPFPPEDCLPSIVDMKYDNIRNTIVLSLLSSGEDSETLAVFYQDIVRTNSFDTLTSWKIADTSISCTGSHVVEWADTDTVSRLPVNKVEGRCYFVGRVDLDENRNGKSDLMEWWQTSSGDFRLERFFAQNKVSNGNLVVSGGKMDRALWIAFTNQMSAVLAPRYWERLYLAGTSVDLYPSNSLEKLKMELLAIQQKKITRDREFESYRKTEEFRKQQREEWKLRKEEVNATQAINMAVSRRYPELASLLKREESLSRDIRENEQRFGRESKEYKTICENNLPELRKVTAQIDDLKTRAKIEFSDLNAAFTNAHTRLLQSLGRRRYDNGLEDEQRVISCRIQWQEKIEKAVKNGFPKWWSESGLSTNQDRRSDNEPLRGAMFKKYVCSAVDEVNKHLAAKKTSRLDNLKANLQFVKDDHVVTRGELLGIAKQFYDFFFFLNVLPDIYPWGGKRIDENLFLAAPVGELRYLFSFDPASKSCFPLAPKAGWEPWILEVRDLHCVSLFEPVNSRDLALTNGAVIESMELPYEGSEDPWSRHYLSNATFKGEGWNSSNLAFRVNGQIFPLSKTDSVDITDVVRRVGKKSIIVELIYYEEDPAAAGTVTNRY